MLRRLVGLPLAVLVSVTLAFVLLRLLPGDPVEAILAESGASPALVEQWRQQYGTDGPVQTQYWLFLRSIASGDFGTSLIYRQPVSRLLLEQLPATLELSLAAGALSVVIGMALGVMAAWWRGTALDAVSRWVAVISASLPTFWTGLMAIDLFSARLRWFPSVGTGTVWHLALPAMVLALASAGVFARVVRVSLLEAAAQPHVQVAHAKGLPQSIVISRHVFRLAAPAIITLLGLQAGFLMAGTAITETVFSRPGIGRLLVEAVVSQDYPLAQGTIVATAVTYAVMGALADLAAALVDPRVRTP